MTTGPAVGASAAPSGTGRVILEASLVTKTFTTPDGRALPVLDDVLVPAVRGGDRRAARQVGIREIHAVINIGSTAGLRPRPGVSAYSATKGAVHTLTKALAGELAADRIRVCAIAPVATETPLLPSFLGPKPGMREKFIATIPLGRLAVTQDVANAALFLASADAEFLTGNIVEVDGGRCV